MTNVSYAPLNSINQQYYPYTPNIYSQQPYNQAYDDSDEEEERKVVYDPKITEQRIEHWYQIPNDESEYSSLWSDESSFEASSFSENCKKINRYNDVVWGIAFLINFAVTLIIAIILSVKYKNSNYDPYEQYTTPLALKCLGIGAGFGIIINFLHLLYAVLIPLIYIRFGIFISCVYIIAFVAVPSLITGNYVFFLFPLLMIVGAIFFFILGQRYAKFSASIFKQSCNLMFRYPQLIVFWILVVIIDSLINGIFSFLTFLVQANHWNNWFYLYLVFSFCWISVTFSYCAFMVASGVTATWYFLNGTMQFPKNPVLYSAKRAFTTSFGSAACAGLIMAILRLLDYIINIPVQTNHNVLNAIVQLLKCMAQCILAILRGCFHMINRFSLCYVSIYGIPFKEGMRRWIELRTKRCVGSITSGITVERCLQYNMMIFVAGGSLLSYGISILIFGKESEGTVFVPVFTSFFAYGIFKLFEQPLIGICECLIVCFAEAPKLMKTSAYELYEVFLERYGEEVVNQQIMKGKI